jgi:hypothetical protein
MTKKHGNNRHRSQAEAYSQRQTQETSYPFYNQTQIISSAPNQNMRGYKEINK